MILVGNSHGGLNTKETKVRGKDNRGEFRVGQRRDQVQLQYSLGKVDLAARQLQESTQQRS